MYGHATNAAGGICATNGPLDDRFLMNVAQRLGNNSMELGVMLGLPSCEVQRIGCDQRDVLSANFAILLSWSSSPHQGSPNTMRDELRQGLINIGRTDLAELV